MGIYLTGLSALWLIWMFSSYGMTTGTLIFSSMHLQFIIIGLIFLVFHLHSAAFICFIFTISIHLLLEIIFRMVPIKIHNIH